MPSEVKVEAEIERAALLTCDPSDPATAEYTELWAIHCRNMVPYFFWRRLSLANDRPRESQVRPICHVRNEINEVHCNPHQTETEEQNHWLR